MKRVPSRVDSSFSGLEEAILAKEEKSKSIERRQPNRLQRYFRETVGELRRVTWPTRQEAINLTIIVLIVTISMSAFLWVLDTLFNQVFVRILGS